MNIYDAAKILGLSGDITPEQIKAAYREACKTYHPDINPVGEEMMKLVNAAYEAFKEQILQKAYSHAQSVAKKAKDYKPA